MPSALTRLVQVLALLTLLLGGLASHDLAMASGSMHEQHALVDAHGSMGHHGMHDVCDGSTCDEQGPPCCVMGQCLIGIPPAGEFLFAVADLPEPEALVALGHHAGIVRLPFRPPASV